MKRYNRILCAAGLIIGVYGQIPALAATAADNDNSSTSNADNPVGPLRIGITYSDQFGGIVDTKWNNYLTDNSAFDFGLNVGGQEFLLGGTYAYRFNPANRFKITAEHLAQNFAFDYLTKKENQFVGENQFGLDYQHFLTNLAYVQGVELGAYGAKTENETFPSNQFTTSQDTFTDLRDVAGGKSFGFAGGLNLLPWNDALLNTFINYDNVRYATQFQPANNSAGLGATLGLTQIITDHFKVDAAASKRQPFSQLQLGADYLLPSRPGDRLELELNGWHLSGDIPTGTENRITLSLAISWDGDPCAPRPSYNLADVNSFINYTDQPAMMLPAVLLQQDEGIRQ